MSGIAWMTVTWLATEALAFACGALWMRRRLVSRLADRLFEEQVLAAVDEWEASGCRTYSLDEARAMLEVEEAPPS